MKQKEILPPWIRFFAWIFLLFAITPLAYIPSVIWDFEMGVSGFGIEVMKAKEEPILALYVTSLLTRSSMVAYGILWGKKWAVDLGIFYGIVALITSIASMAEGINEIGIRIGAEPLFLIPFLITLYLKRREWREFQPETPKTI